MKHWAAAQILVDAGQKKAGVRLMETTLKSSLKFEINDLSYSILRELKLHYGLFEYDKRKHEHYSLLYSKIKKNLNLLDELNEIYEFLGHYVESKKSHNYNEQIKQCEDKLRKLKKEVKLISNYEHNLKLYSSEYFIQMIKKDIPRQLEIVNEASSFFENKKGFRSTARFMFAQLKGITLLNLKKVGEAKDAFIDLKKFGLREGALSWQSTYNYIFFCHILLEEYDDAHEVLSYVMNNKSFNKLYEEFRQQWYLKEAYIKFLIEIEKIDEGSLKLKRKKSFRLGKFLNEVPSLSKDKKGYNLSIQIIQVLFFLVQKKDDHAINKIESLTQYRTRYLKGKENIRANTFIKLLAKVPLGNFKKKHIVRLTKKLENTLASNPMDYSEQSMTTEIIPYDVMWSQLLDHLESSR